MIGINIWNDFYEDEDVPEGEIQETYMYVEEHSLSEDTKKFILGWIFNKIEFDNLLDSSTQCKLFYFDSKEKYPNLSPENSHLHFTRWEIRFKNITHQQVKILVDKLNKLELKLNNEQIEFYSGS
jgi:hypothetical protein